MNRHASLLWSDPQLAAVTYKTEEDQIICDETLWSPLRWAAMVTA